MRKPVKKKAFTLIELLVVIAVIAILMSILVPALGVARDKARAVVCGAHLSGWGRIWTVYLSENNDSFPTGTEWPGFAGSDPDWFRGQWIVALENDVRQDEDILLCPAAKTTIPGSAHGDTTHTYGMPAFPLAGETLKREVSFGYNCWAYNPRQIGNSDNIQGRLLANHWRKRSTIEYAEEVPLLLDAKWRGGGPHFRNGNAYAPAPVVPEQASWGAHPELHQVKYEMMHFQVPRHAGAYGDTLFVDGHVERVGMKKLYQLRWHIDYPVAQILDMPDTFWPQWMVGLPD